MSGGARRDPWGISRSAALAAVLAVHLAMLALLLAASRTQSVAASGDKAILLLQLPPATPRAKALKVHAEHIRPQPRATAMAIALAPLVLDSASRPGPSTEPDGHGAAVDWAAEAHRALRAFEIRRDQPPNSALSVSSPLEDWWRREHHPGDQFKTESGDWIVWINANCYQVASWRSDAAALGMPPPPTRCQAQGGTPRSP
jgi:hypothetical protein